MNEAIMVSGKDAVLDFQMMIITTAMRTYINTGMKVNRAYTPAAMLNYASSKTGKKYKRSALREAYNDLREAFPALNIRPLS